MAFQQAMDAVIDLAAFGEKHMPSLDDVSAEVQRIAAKQIPQATTAQHAAATNVVITTFEAILKSSSGSPAASGEKDDTEPLHLLATLQGDIEAIVPGSSAFTHYLVPYIIASRRPTRKSVMYAALLTTSVGNFEVLVSAVIREFLRLKPEAIRSDDERYSLGDIEGYETLNEFRAHCAELYAEKLLRGSLEDWMHWFQKNLKISLDDITSDPAGLVEVFQRRHLVVHNGGMVNRQYLNKVKVANTLDTRSILEVDGEYLDKSIDRLVCAGILLLIAVMRKVVSPVNNEHGADTIASDAVYDFLQRRRWELAINIASACAAECASDSIRLTIQVNGWIARKNAEGINAVRTEVERWQVDALAPRFHLAKMALLDQVEDAYELGQQLLQTKEITTRDWFTWPLLEGVRTYETKLAAEADREVLAIEKQDDDSVGHGITSAVRA